MLWWDSLSRRGGFWKGWDVDQEVITKSSDDISEQGWSNRVKAEHAICWGPELRGGSQEQVRTPLKSVIGYVQETAMTTWSGTFWDGSEVEEVGPNDRN